MAREALNSHSSTNSIPSYRQKNKATKKINTTIVNPVTQRWTSTYGAEDKESFVFHVGNRTVLKHHLNTIYTQWTEQEGDNAGAITVGSISTNSDWLEHMLFQPGKGWKRIESMQHPTLQLTVNIDPSNYHEL